MRAAVFAAIVLLASAGVARADDSLAAARELYAAAAYEEALAALNRVRAAGVAPADALVVEEYRVFCLLALGRGPEAQQAIETLVLAAPLYRPSVDMSPRVRTAFSDVRRRLLPTLITQNYAKAKASFDKGDYSAAAAGFEQVIAALNDPDVQQAAAEPPLRDLRTLAAGFQELSAKAAAPPPPPPQPAPAVATTPEPSVSEPPAPRVYTGVDPEVVQPATLRQDLPTFTGRLTGLGVGAMEVVINEQGLVEQATIRASVSQAYDREALNATRNWRFRPAMVNGVPVKFRKIVQIAIKPTS